MQEGNIKSYAYNNIALKGYFDLNRFRYIPSRFKNNAQAGINSIFVDENFINNLPEDQAEFIIGHEVAHVKNMHVIKALCLALILSYLDYKLENSLIKNYAPEESKCHFYQLWKMPYTLAYRYATFPIFMAFLSYYKRQLEFEADRVAASALNRVDSAINFFESKITHDKKNESIAQKIKKFIIKIYDTHPSHEERVKALEDLKK